MTINASPATGPTHPVSVRLIQRFRTSNRATTANEEKR
jgi:hypothetical protein